MERIAVLGSGGWGTALAVHLARLGKEVTLWGRDRLLVEEITTTRVNTTYLPGIELPDLVFPTTALDVALRDVSCVVAAVPSHGTRDVVRRAKARMPPDAIVVSATKGLEVGTLLRMSEVIEQELGAARPITVLSGPSFSLELAREAPTAVSVAGLLDEAVTTVQREFRSRYFRLYATGDVVGGGDRRGDEERDRDRGRCGRVARVRAQRARSADHARASRDVQARVGGWGAT